MVWAVSSPDQATVNVEYGTSTSTTGGPEAGVFVTVVITDPDQSVVIVAYGVSTMT